MENQMVKTEGKTYCYWQSLFPDSPKHAYRYDFFIKNHRKNGGTFQEFTFDMPGASERIGQLDIFDMSFRYKRSIYSLHRDLEEIAVYGSVRCGEFQLFRDRLWVDLNKSEISYSEYEKAKNRLSMIDRTNEMWSELANLVEGSLSEQYSGYLIKLKKAGITEEDCKEVFLGLGQRAKKWKDHVLGISIMDLNQHEREGVRIYSPYTRIDPKQQEKPRRYFTHAEDPNITISLENIAVMLPKLVYADVIVTRQYPNICDKIMSAMEVFRGKQDICMQITGKKTYPLGRVGEGIKTQVTSKELLPYADEIVHLTDTMLKKVLKDLGEKNDS